MHSAMKVMVEYYDNLMFKERNRLLQHIIDNNLYFFHDLKHAQFNHIPQLLRKLDEYSQKATGRTHFAQFMKIIHCILIHVNHFLNKPFNVKIAPHFSSFFFYLNKLLSQFKQKRSFDSQEMLIVIQSILFKLLKLSSLGVCPTLRDLSFLLHCELFIHPCIKDTQIQLPEQHSYLSSAFNKAQHFFSESKPGPQLSQRFGQAYLIFTLTPVLNLPRRVLRSTSMLQNMSPFLDPQQALIYSLPLLVQLTQQNVTDFQRVIGVSQEEISIFKLTHFSRQAESQNNGIQQCARYTAAVSILNSRQLSSNLSLQLLQLSTQLALTSSLSFLNNPKSINPPTTKKEFNYAKELVYPYLAQTKYAYSLHNSEILIQKVVKIIQTQLESTFAENSSNSIKPLHYILSTLLCHQVALKFEIQLSTLIKTQKMIDFLLNYYFQNPKGTLKLFLKSHFELTQSRVNLQSDSTHKLGAQIRSHFSSLQSNGKNQAIWSSKEGILSLRLQINYAWLLLNKKCYAEVCSFFLNLYGQQNYTSLLQKDPTQQSERKPGIIKLQDPPYLPLLQILKCLILLSEIRAHFLDQKHYKLYQCLLRDLIPTLQKRLHKAMNQVQVEATIFTRFHGLYLKYGFTLSEDSIIQLCFAFQDSVATVRAVLTKLMTEVCEIGSELGDVGLMLYYKFEKCRLGRGLSITSYHDSVLRLLHVERQRASSQSFLFPCKVTFDMYDEYETIFSTLARQFSELNKSIPANKSFDIKQFQQLLEAILANQDRIQEMPSRYLAFELLLALPQLQFSQFSDVRLFSQYELEIMMQSQFPEYLLRLKEFDTQKPHFNQYPTDLPIRVIPHQQFLKYLKSFSSHAKRAFNFIDDPFIFHFLISCFGSKVSHYFKAFNPNLEVFPFNTSQITIPDNTSLVALVLDRESDTFYVFKYYSPQQFFIVSLTLQGAGNNLKQLETKLFEFEYLALNSTFAKSTKILISALSLFKSEVEPILSPLLPFILPRPSDPKLQALILKKAENISRQIPVSPLLIESILLAFLDNRILEQMIQPVLKFYSSHFAQISHFEEIIRTSVGELRSLIEDPVGFQALIYIPDYSLANFQLQIFQSLSSIPITRLPSCSFLASHIPSTLNLTRGTMLVDASVNAKEDLYSTFKELNWDSQYVLASTLTHKIKTTLLNNPNKNTDIIAYGGHGASSHPTEFGQEFKDISKINSILVILSCHPLYYQDCGPYEGFSQSFNFLLKQWYFLIAYFSPLLIGSISVVYNSHAQKYLEALKEELLKNKREDVLGLFEHVKRKNSFKNFPPLMMGLPVQHDPSK